MNKIIKFGSNQASENEVAEHLLRCDGVFVPPLSGRVEIVDYARKIVSKAMRLEAWEDMKLVGLVAVYCNDHDKRIAYLTSVSVLKEWMGKGIATCLVKQCIEYATVSGMRQISLEVASSNLPAIWLYEKNGFVMGEAHAGFVTMNLYLKSGEEHG